MTLSNGNIFHVTGPLWRESTGHRWIPLTKASDAELWCFLWSVPEKWLSKQSRRWWFETSSRSLWRHCDTHNYLGQTVESISDILHLCVQMINDGFTLMSEIYVIISCDSCSSTVDAAYSYQDDVMTRRHWTSCWRNIRLTGNLRRHKMHVHIKLYTDMYLIHSP